MTSFSCHPEVRKGPKDLLKHKKRTRGFSTGSFIDIIRKQLFHQPQAGQAKNHVYKVEKRCILGKVIGGMTLSLDGFVSDIHGDVSQLYPDLGELRQTEMLQEEIRTTGAVVMGRNTYEMGGPDAFDDGYEYQVPIFVLTHDIPEKKPKGNDALTITFVTDGIQSAIAQAKAAAGDRNVMLIGVSINHQCLQAGLCDELHFGIMPVLLGSGMRFFDGFDTSGLRLEKFRFFESGDRADLWYRVVR